MRLRSLFSNSRQIAPAPLPAIPEEETVIVDYRRRSQPGQGLVRERRQIHPTDENYYYGIQTDIVPRYPNDPLVQANRRMMERYRQHTQRRRDLRDQRESDFGSQPIPKAP
jgi:hypothetical protein